MSTLTSEPLSQVRSERIRWLWEPYLARGKITLLDGDPGVGKSLITLDLAARLSRGGPLVGVAPNVLDGRPHVTLLLGAEDATADTTCPRADAAGADLERVISVSEPNGSPLFFPERLPDLEERITFHKADLVVIDPIMAFLPPKVAATIDQCVRLALRPLALLAERHDCAILLVRHLRKTSAPRAVLRGLGSIGIIGSARTGLLAARHPSDPSLGVLAVTKTNLASGGLTLTYRVQANPLGHPIIEWIGDADLSADDVGKRPPAPLRMRDRAIAWLHAQLAAGPRRAADLFAAAGEASIPEKTLNRAKSDLGAKSHKAHFRDHSEWYWYDPCAPWPADAPFPQPYEYRPQPLDPLPSIAHFTNLPPLDEVLGSLKRHGRRDE